MFDPLELYSADEPARVDDAIDYEVFDKFQPEDEVLKEGLAEEEDIEEDSMVAVLDLPAFCYASAEMIGCVLLLLQPDIQVNFNADSEQDRSVEQICLEKHIPRKYLNALLLWYSDIYPNKNLDTYEKICNKIPLVRNTSQRELLLSYYTSILKKYENLLQSADTTEDDQLLAQHIVKEVSLRISENCGRTAQPSMTREFRLDNLNHVIVLYEPSLTADNLGWKTWGSSLILSQKIVDLLEEEGPQPPKNKKLRVLELGSGTGLVGISWACKWKEQQLQKNADADLTSSIQIYLTDLPEITDNLKKNVITNELESFVVADVLDWTNPQSFIDTHTLVPFDIILIADPIYSPMHPEWLVNMIAKFLSKDADSPRKCYLQIPIRAKYNEERTRLWSLLESNGLTVVNEEHDSGRDDWGIVDYLYKELAWK